MIKNRLRILAGLAAALAVAGLVTVVSASPASAAPTSTCTVSFPGPQCNFWNQNYNDSIAGVVETVYDYPVSGSTPYTYQSADYGQGEYIGNNNGSNRNYDSLCYATLWYNPAVGGVFSGISFTLFPNGVGTYQASGSGLGTLLNNIRGQSWQCTF